MKTAFSLLFVTVNLWFAAAKPYPQWIHQQCTFYDVYNWHKKCTFPLFTALDQDAEIELLANLIEETDGTKVGLEEVGNSQLDIEELGNEKPLPLIENQGYTKNLHPLACT